MDLHVLPGQAYYCSDCRVVYGVVMEMSTPCRCARSAAIPLRGGGRDFPTPFELCWFCQAVVIRSGNKMSAYGCDKCRPVVSELNDTLDARHAVSLPIGRHSLMHGRWAHARPFTGAKVLADWCDARLDQAWASHAGGDDWCEFSLCLEKRHWPTLREDLVALAVQLQDTEIDWLYEALIQANRRRLQP